MTPNEKRLKAQEDKARARLVAADLAIPEALGGTGDMPEQPTYLEPDDQATARAEKRAAIQANKAQARLVAAGRSAPTPIEPSGDWPREEPEPELESEHVTLEEATALEAQLLNALGALEARFTALEKRLEGFSLEKSIEAHEELLSRVKVLEAMIDDSPEAESSSNSRLEGQPCGCDPGLERSSPHRPLIRFYACENYPDCAYGRSEKEDH